MITTDAQAIAQTPLTEAQPDSKHQLPSWLTLSSFSDFPYIFRHGLWNITLTRFKSALLILPPSSSLRCSQPSSGTVEEAEKTKIFDCSELLCNNWKYWCDINVVLFQNSVIPATLKKHYSDPTETKAISTSYSVPFMLCSGPIIILYILITISYFTFWCTHKSHSHSLWAIHVDCPSMKFIYFMTSGTICCSSPSVQERWSSVGLVHADDSSDSIRIHSSLIWIVLSEIALSRPITTIVMMTCGIV